jgi:hypothetical protein
VARNCLFRPISAANRLALNLSVPIQVNEGSESERHSPATNDQVPSEGQDHVHDGEWDRVETQTVRSFSLMGNGVV